MMSASRGTVRQQCRMRRCVLAAVSALVVAGLLAGCGSLAASTGPLPEVAADPALVAKREASGIEDCPVTQASVQPVAGGLPDLVLGCLGSGRQVNLAGLRGKPMVIHFWAQWCGHCRAEAPHLTEFAERAGDKVLLLGIDFADPDPGRALDFASYAGWKFPQLTDPLRQTAGPVRFSGIPVTILVDAQGRIVHRTIGEVRSAQQLIDDTRKYLGVKL